MRSYSDDSNVADSLKSEIADGFDLGVNSKYILTFLGKKTVKVYMME